MTPDHSPASWRVLLPRENGAVGIVFDQRKLSAPVDISPLEMVPRAQTELAAAISVPDGHKMVVFLDWNVWYEVACLSVSVYSMAVALDSFTRNSHVLRAPNFPFHAGSEP